MDLGTARKLVVGDPVIAIKDGLSAGIWYTTGQCGTVLFKDDPASPFFGVRLDAGDTGHVDGEKWESVVYSGAT